MAKKTDALSPQPPHNDELQRSATYFWGLAQEQGLSPEELAELLRRLASGELCENVLPQRFLPFSASPTPDATTEGAACARGLNLLPYSPRQAERP